MPASAPAAVHEWGPNKAAELGGEPHSAKPRTVGSARVCARPCLPGTKRARPRPDRS